VSLTFSDSGASASYRTYRTTVAVVLSTLLVLVGVVATLSVLQGPQLRSVSADTQGLVTRGGVAVTLRADRALTPIVASQLEITPDARFELETLGLTLRLTFVEPLRADETYRITVGDVRPRNFGPGSTWSTEFTTGSLGFFYISEEGQNTALVRAVVAQQSPEVLYEAPGIIGFTRVGAVMAVLRKVSDNTVLELLDPQSGLVETIGFPPGVEILSLASAPWGTSVVVMMNLAVGEPGEIRGTVALIDMLGNRTPEVVLGIDGNSVSARKVFVSAIGGDVVIWLRNQGLLRFDPLTTDVVPAGSASEVWGFDALGSSLVYVDGLGTVTQNLRTGDLTRVPLGRLEGITLNHEHTTVAPDGTTVQRVMLPGIDGGDPFTLVTRDDGSGIHQMLTGNLSSPESIGAVSLSPNGQYVLVEHNTASTPLGYVGLSATQVAAGTVTRVIGVATNTIVDEFLGHSFIW
jgi:hypothetical protein